MAKAYVGTSGWSYAHWRGRFYPADLPVDQWLSFYTRHFSTLEVNSTFYRTPFPGVIKHWVKTVPDDFIFSFKASRYLTHVLRLKVRKENLRSLFAVAKDFDKKLGVILFQLPPSLKFKFADWENFAGKLVAFNSKKFRFAIEPRNETWFCDDFFNLAQKYNIAFCISDTPYYPYAEKITADFVYLRLHGHKILYCSKYTHRQLEMYAKKIRNWLKQGLDVYVYFDNDAFANAVDNALELKKMI